MSYTIKIELYAWGLTLLKMESIVAVVNKTVKTRAALTFYIFKVAN